MPGPTIIFLDDLGYNVFHETGFSRHLYEFSNNKGRPT